MNHSFKNQTNIDVIIDALQYTINPRLRDVGLDFGEEEVMKPESPDILPWFETEYDATAGKFMVNRIRLQMDNVTVGYVNGRWSEDDGALLEFCEELQYYCDRARKITA